MRNVSKVISENDIMKEEREENIIGFQMISVHSQLKYFLIIYNLVLILTLKIPYFMLSLVLR